MTLESLACGVAKNEFEIRANNINSDANYEYFLIYKGSAFYPRGLESAGSKAIALRNTQSLNLEEWLIFSSRIARPWMGEVNAAFATPALMWQKERIVISLLKLMESRSTEME